MIMTLLLIDIILLLALLFLGVPLPYCFAGALGFMVLTNDINMMSLVTWGISQMISLTLVAGPVFILAGTLLNVTKICDKLLDVANLFTGKMKSGIGLIAIITCGFLGAISGSAFTGVSAVGPALHPKMVEMGYPRGYATALITASTILGILIPPSVTMITFGWVTGTSVLACFLSTVIPGIVLIILLGIINAIDAKKFIKDDVHMRNQKADGENKVAHAKKVLWSGLPGLIMPVIILGGIYGGIFTPTEAAAVAAFVAVVIGVFCYKTLNPRNFFSSFRDSASSIGSIMMMIFFCLLLSQSYVLLKIPETLVSLFMGFTENKFFCLLLFNIFLLFVGMIVHDSTAIVLCAPLLMPLCQAYGVSGVQLAAIMCVNLGFGGLTPPYASVLYLGMRVCDTKFEEIMPPTIKFLVLAYLPVTLLTTYISGMSTFLPTLFGYM